MGKRVCIIVDDVVVDVVVVVIILVVVVYDVWVIGSLTVGWLKSLVSVNAVTGNCGNCSTIRFFVLSPFWLGLYYPFILGTQQIF